MSEALDEKDLRIFRELVKSSVNYDYDLNTQYGPEVGFKTILHLALEEEDGFPYVEELLLVRFFSYHLPPDFCCLNFRALFNEKNCGSIKKVVKTL